MSNPNASGSFVDNEENRRDLQVLETITEWMDRRYLDPILGFLAPGIGDTLCSLIGLYGVIVAGRLRVHPVVIARMLINLALDAFIGGIPILGWIGDFFYRAHVQNLELLRARGERGDPQASDWWFVLGAALIFLFAVSLPLLLVLAFGGLLLAAIF